MFYQPGYDPEEQFKELYDKFFRKVYGFAYKYTRSTEESEDIAQEVFLKLWSGFDALPDEVSVDVQLLVITRQLLINRYRRELVKQKVLKNWTSGVTEYSESDNSDQPLLVSELSDRFQQAVKELPPKRKVIFEKSRMEGLSYDEIAQQLSLSRGTVESQMVKALRSIREKLLSLPLLFF